MISLHSTNNLLLISHIKLLEHAISTNEMAYLQQETITHILAKEAQLT